MDQPAILKLIFPQLKGTWGEVNFAAVAADLAALVPGLATGDNPFLDPDTCTAWANFVRKVKGVDYLWGGYLEEREQLWRGSYLRPGNGTHMGVDLWVRAGVDVHMPYPGVLVHSSHDPDQEGGWGGKLIFRTAAGFTIFGHMKEILSPADLGRTYQIGEKIGVVAGADKNGGWSPHLHVQRTRTFLPDVDGYGPTTDAVKINFPNPLDIPWGDIR